MDQERFVTIEETEAATASLLENGKKVGADSWQQRVKNQTPHCGFGEAGTCCRICAMGPCRITPKSPRGICGCDVHGIVGRNFLKFTAGGSATHSDHGREIMHTLHQTKEGGNYQVKDPEKLIRIAHEWGVETEGKDIYELAHEMAEIGLMEYGKPFGVQRFLKRAPEHTQELWHKAEIEPRAIDLATKNRDALGLTSDEVAFSLTNLVSSIPHDEWGTFDVLVSNPPYIPRADIATLDTSVRDYEPHLALDGGEDGLDFYRSISEKWKEALNVGGRLYFEVGIGQADSVLRIMRSQGFGDIQVVKDLHGIPRVVFGTLCTEL